MDHSGWFHVEIYMRIRAPMTIGHHFILEDTERIAALPKDKDTRHGKHMACLLCKAGARAPVMIAAITKYETML